MLALYELRTKTTPIYDYVYLNWPLYIRQVDKLKLPKIKKYEIGEKRVYMVADVLDEVWNVLSKDKIVESREELSSIFWNIRRLRKELLLLYRMLLKVHYCHSQ